MLRKMDNESILLDDTIISITLYPNMSSLEQDRVYKKYLAFDHDNSRLSIFDYFSIICYNKFTF